MADSDITAATVFIYGLIDPRNGHLRYVGRTKRALSVRLSGHLQGARKASNRHVHSWIRGVLAAGMKPQIILLEQSDALSWGEAEQFWIAYFRALGADLTNIAAGGLGALGFHHTAAQREKWSRERRGENHPWHGKKRPAEHFLWQEPFWASRAGEHGNRKGAVVSEETRRKMSESASGRQGVNHAKLTAEKVRAIRLDPRSASEIAGEYCVSKSAVLSVRSGKSWKHVR